MKYIEDDENLCILIGVFDEFMNSLKQEEINVNEVICPDTVVTTLY